MGIFTKRAATLPSLNIHWLIYRTNSPSNLFTKAFAQTLIFESFKIRLIFNGKSFILWWDYEVAFQVAHSSTLPGFHLLHFLFSCYRSSFLLLLLLLLVKVQTSSNQAISCNTLSWRKCSALDESVCVRECVCGNNVRRCAGKQFIYAKGIAVLSI